MPIWTMKQGRVPIQLARENLSVDQIAVRMKRSPSRFVKTAKRLGISDRAQGEEIMPAQRRQGNWTAEEDRRLLELIDAGKSWVFICANLKRPASGARLRLAHLKRQAIKAGSFRAEAEDETMSPSTSARRPWTACERTKLDELANAGKTAPEIATTLQRTPTSIYAQLQRLDVKRGRLSHRLVELGSKAKR
jgi:hypothetical protein